MGEEASAIWSCGVEQLAVGWLAAKEVWADVPVIRRLRSSPWWSSVGARLLLGAPVVSHVAYSIG